jgi:hypothetical protein
MGVIRQSAGVEGGSLAWRALLLLVHGVAGAAVPAAGKLTGVETHLAANDIEVKNGSAQALTACRLSFDHRLRSGLFDLPAGQVLRISLEDFHVDPPGPPPPEVQFSYVFLECREGSRRFATA